jgi:hypothetical protein
MQRNLAVLETIAEIDHAMLISGARDFCLACINRTNPHVKGGCCQGCKLLGAEGCLEKPLSCAQWLCRTAQERFPELSKQMQQIATERHGYAVAKSFRANSLQAELVQIQGETPKCVQPVTW